MPNVQELVLRGVSQNFEYGKPFSNLLHNVLSRLRQRAGQLPLRLQSGVSKKPEGFVRQLSSPGIGRLKGFWSQRPKQELGASAGLGVGAPAGGTGCPKGLIEVVSIIVRKKRLPGAIVLPVQNSSANYPHQHASFRHPLLQ